MSVMQRRHYTLIAGIIRDMHDNNMIDCEGCTGDPYGDVASYFAQRLKQDNLKFDVEKFLAACKYE